jgi:hypothetical protein
MGFGFWVLLVLMVWVPWSSAYAQTITRVQPLSFGTFALKNNSAVHTLRVSRTNVVTSDPAFIVIVAPTRGEYNLAGFPASTAFTVSIPDESFGAGATFTLDQFTPGVGLSFDSAGEANLRFGATLSTSGSGTMYTEGANDGTIDITINY